MFNRIIFFWFKIFYIYLEIKTQKILVFEYISTYCLKDGKFFIHSVGILEYRMKLNFFMISCWHSKSFKIQKFLLWKMLLLWSLNVKLLEDLKVMLKVLKLKFKAQYYNSPLKLLSKFLKPTRRERVKTNKDISSNNIRWK